MAKMSVKWHQECLKNQLAFLIKKNVELTRLQKEIERMEEDVDFYQHQIDKALAIGKDDFDRDKFAIKRGERT